MRETRKRAFRDHFSFFLGFLLFLSWTGPIASAQMIGSVSPTAGPSGTSVTITGSGFGKRQGSSTVTFNGTPAAVTSWIDSEVSVAVPEGATSGPVVVTVDGESTEAEDHFRVIIPVSPPSLSALSPAASPRHSNAVGMAVTLTGSGFGDDQGSNAVTFNGAPAAVIAWSETRIRVKLPEGATTGPVVVTAHDEPSNPLAFTVFPQVSSLSPAAGPAGSAFTIYGSHFGGTAGAGSVRFNGLPAPIIRWSESQIVAAVPDGAASGPVVVTVNEVPSNADQLFAVRSVSSPMIASLFPGSAPSGTSVIIIGSGFGGAQGAGAVTFNGTPATVLGWTETQVIATVPDGATSGPVVVTAHEAISNRNQVFTVTSESTFSLTSIALTPEHPTLTVGQTVSLTPVGIFKNGFAQPLSLATVTAGISHTCAVFSEGTVSCWGENTFGQLGNGSTLPSTVPVKVRGIDSATGVAAGGAHTCALLSEGRVVCWGDNSAGQLGNGTTTGSALPVEVTGITHAVAIRATGHYTCADLSDGATQCWGADSSGALGNAAALDSSTPVTVDRIGNPQPIPAGVSATCILSEGRVNCWGDNTFGQLGNGTGRGSVTPVRVDGVDGALAIAAGSYHTCTVLSNGTLSCWGAGISGQLGDGKAAGSSVPVTVSGIKSAAAVIWTSSDPSVATVDANGRAIALRPGLTTVSATSRGVSGSTTLLVDSPAPSAPASASAMANRFGR